jgi:uncharacterized protein YndB with AHSA1/START domain
MESNQVIGKTRDAGFQVGTRRTFPLSLESAWEKLFCAKGMEYWLGKGDFEALEPGGNYTSESGITARVRLVQPLSHLRMSWHKPGWENTSTLQIRLIAKGSKTILSFHQEKLSGPEQRAEMKAFWESRMNALAAYLAE